LAEITPALGHHGSGKAGNRCGHLFRNISPYVVTQTKQVLTEFWVTLVHLGCQIMTGLGQKDDQCQVGITAAECSLWAIFGMNQTQFSSNTRVTAELNGELNKTRPINLM